MLSLGIATLRATPVTPTKWLATGTAVAFAATTAYAYNTYLNECAKKRTVPHSFSTFVSTIFKNYKNASTRSAISMEEKNILHAFTIVLGLAGLTAASKLNNSFFADTPIIPATKTAEEIQKEQIAQNQAAQAEKIHEADTGRNEIIAEEAGERTNELEAIALTLKMEALEKKAIDEFQKIVDEENIDSKLLEKAKPNWYLLKAKALSSQAFNKTWEFCAAATTKTVNAGIGIKNATVSVATTVKDTTVELCTPVVIKATNTGTKIVNTGKLALKSAETFARKQHILTPTQEQIQEEQAEHEKRQAIERQAIERWNIQDQATEKLVALVTEEDAAFRELQELREKQKQQKALKVITKVLKKNLEQKKRKRAVITETAIRKAQEQEEQMCLAETAKKEALKAQQTATPQKTWGQWLTDRTKALKEKTVAFFTEPITDKEITGNITNKLDGNQRNALKAYFNISQAIRLDNKDGLHDRYAKFQAKFEELKQQTTRSEKDKEAYELLAKILVK